MPKYNIIWYRDLELFRQHKFEVTKVELTITAKTFKGAVKEAQKRKHKGFYLAGIVKVRR